MAKAKGGAKEARKVTFGKRKGGKARKSKGPKDANKSKYRRQGRI